MMMQLAHVFLLIVCLLLCPLRCMGTLTQAECAHRSQEQASSCCGQCQEQQPSVALPGSDRQPENPADDCGCGSCLCHGGAMVDIAGIDVAHSDRFSCVTPLPAADAHSHLSLLLGASHSRHPSPFPPLASGREVCALTSTLLL